MLITVFFCVFWGIVGSFSYLLVRTGAKPSPLPLRSNRSRHALVRVACERSEIVVVRSHFTIDPR
jgi:hypothetical protein